MLGTFSSPSTKFINDWLLCPTGLVSTSLVSLFWFLTVNTHAKFLVTAPSPLAPRSHIYCELYALAHTREQNYTSKAGLENK